MRLKSYLIITLLCVFTLLFATEFIFAGNIGRTVYGVYTETYNGVGLYDDSAGNDKVTFYSDTWNIEANYTIDKFEGIKSLQVSSSTYVCFVFFNGAQNMSAYEGGKIYFSLKCPIEISTDSAGIKIEDTSGAKEIKFNSSLIKRVNSTETGIDNNGTWHTYYIELSNFVNLGLDLNNITCPLILTNTTIGNDNFYLIDNVYWTKASSATRAFNVTVKNISDNEECDDITWAQSAYRKSWIAAEQYIELDLDQESTNWTVNIYLNNSSSTRNGLYCVDSDGSEIVLPMAWRVRPDLLSSEKFTLLIGENDDGGLYDIGKNPTGTDWYTWVPIKEINNETIQEYDYVTVWNLRGIHTVVKYHDSYDTLANYYERKPKIYFAADCSNAIGGLTYNASVVTELVYE